MTTRTSTEITRNTTSTMTGSTSSKARTKATTAPAAKGSMKKPAVKISPIPKTAATPSQIQRHNSLSM